MAHVTKSGNQSQAWKDLENRVAELFRRAGFQRAARVIKETHDSAPDVDLPEIPELAIDSKYSSRGFPQHSQFLAEVDTYAGLRRRGEDRTYTWGIMPIRPSGSSDILVVLRLERLIELLQAVFLRGKSGGWGCMRCGNPVTESACFAGQYHYRCTVCGMECSTSETPDPKHKGRIASQREKLKSTTPKIEKAVIKDRSTEPGAADTVPTYHPLPGQLSTKDLIERAKNPKPVPKKQRKTKEKKTS